MTAHLQPLELCVCVCVCVCVCDADMTFCVPWSLQTDGIKLEEKSHQLHIGLFGPHTRTRTHTHTPSWKKRLRSH